MTKAATEEATTEAPETPGADLRHDREHLKGIRERAAEEAERAEAEFPDTDDADTDEPAGEGEGEGETDEPTGAAGAGKSEADLKRPPFEPLTKGCPVCQGWGTVSTHSDVSEYLERRCWRCKGAGYLERTLPPEDEETTSDWRAPTPEISY